MQQNKTIKGFRLRKLDNSLYMGFMREVKSFLAAKTPAAMGIEGCATKFVKALEKANRSKRPRSKHPLTKELAILHENRKARLRCLKGHVWADLDNEDPEVREHARILRNKIDSYGNLMRASRRVLAANLNDMYRDMSVEPLRTHVEKLGQMANLNAIHAANTAFQNTLDERVDSKKQIIPNAFRDARIALDQAYRELVAAVNSQIIRNMLGDDVKVENIAELEDFAKIVNVLIKSYRTTMKQSGPDKKKDADDTDDADSKP